MGGYGSGRPSRNQKVEDFRILDIYKMKRLGCLDAGRRGNWIWSRNGQEVARIGYHCHGSLLMLDYKVRCHGHDWETIAQTVPLVRANCHFGGYRIYALCPGVVNGKPCGRRVGKLYAGGRYFLCRQCYHLSYACQSEPRHYRLLRRANKLRVELGGEPGMANFIAVRPKGMWRETYRRKCREIEWYESEADLAFYSAITGNHLNAPIDR